MQVFLMVGLLSACLTAVGSGLFLVALSYMGTGFGFGDLKKDLLKLAAVSALVGVADGLWTFAPMHHWSFHVIVMLVHGILLRLFFFEDLSGKEASMVAVVTRVFYFIAALVLMAMVQSNA